MSVISKGTDYLTTEADPPPSFNFGPPIGSVQFQTRPGIGPGNTNTIRQRLEDAHLPTPGSSDTIACETIGLSIESQNPVEIDGREFDVFVHLTPGKRSLGKMTLTRGTPADPAAEFEGTYTVSVLMFFTAEFTPRDGGAGAFEVPASMVFATPNPGTWTATPNASCCIETADFATAGDDEILNANVHENSPPEMGDFFILAGAYEGASDRGGCVKSASS